MMFNQKIGFGPATIGKDYPCLVIAEIGINHNGNVDLAAEAITSAAQAGADAVKFQNYATEDFISNRDLQLTYQSQGENITESQYDLFKRCELDRDQLAQLKSQCDKEGISFLSTPTSKAGIDDLLSIGTDAIKNGSDYLGHTELIEAMGNTGLPVILSTGMATEQEMKSAVDAFAASGNSNLILLHCVSAYPSPPGQLNLKRIRTLAETYGCLSGFSDHSEGAIASTLAATLGACVIERHFTLSHDLPGPDHWFSSTPDEFKDIVEQVHNAESMLGDPTLGWAECEDENRKAFRLSCVAAIDLPPGHMLQASDVTFRRPGDGIPPAEINNILERTLQSKMERGQVFTEGDFT